MNVIIIHKLKIASYSSLLTRYLIHKYFHMEPAVEGPMMTTLMNLTRTDRESSA